MDTNRVTELINAQVELIEQYRAANVEWRNARYNLILFATRRKNSDFSAHIENELYNESITCGMTVDTLGTRLLTAACDPIYDYELLPTGEYTSDILRDLFWRIVEAYASEILPDTGAMAHEIYAEIMGSYRLIWSNNPDAPASLTQSNPPYTYALRDGILIAYLDNDSGLSYLSTRLGEISPAEHNAHPLRGKHDFLAYTGE